MLLLAGCGGDRSAASSDAPTGASAGTSGSGSGAGEVVVYLVRHGETVFNQLGEMQGWSDSPLTPAGEELADQAGAALADHDFVAAYASDLGRTRATAEHILAGQGGSAPELVTMPELREWYFGGFEGNPNDDAWGTVLSEHGYDWTQVQQDFAGFADEIGGQSAMATMVAESDPLGLAEDADQITTRLVEGFDTLVGEVAEQGGGEVLVVSHGLAIGSLLEALDPQHEATAFHNLALTTITVRDGVATIGTVNDTDYLLAAS